MASKQCASKLIMKKKRDKSNFIKETNEIISIFKVKDKNSKVTYIDSNDLEIMETDTYKKYKKLNTKKDNISFFIKWMIALSIISFLYILITSLCEHKINVVKFVFFICFIIFTATALILSLFLLILTKSKKSKKIISEYETLKENANKNS